MTQTMVHPGHRGQVGFLSPLTVVLHNEAGEELGRKPLADAQLRDLRSELWLQEYLRRGKLDVLERSTSLEVEGRFDHEGAGQGFVARFSGADGLRLQREFDLELALDTATTLVCDATLDGRLKTGDSYAWQVRPDRAPPAEAGAELNLKLEMADPTLEYAVGRVPELEAAAETVGTVHPQDIKVFFLRQAWDRANRFARRGAALDPPVETGAVLVGVLVHCPDTLDLFVVVLDALELVDAEQAKYSLTLTGPTWARVRTILQARRKQPQQRHLISLGQAHGHNFLPDGGAPPCALCAQQKVCTRTSVFLSTDDRRFMRSFMPGQPWQLSYIAGFNARRDEVGCLYGLRNGRLVPRGYYLIDRFEPSGD